ncbi:MAG: carbon-nitrogen hydrolase family protein [Phycisphaerae bacterium]
MVKAYKYLAVITLVATAVIAPDVHAKKITVGVVQTVIENTLDQNGAKLIRFVGEAKAKGCQLVVFPEGALYWPEIAVDNPTRDDIDAAITQISEKARSEKIYVIFGTEYRLTETGSYNNRGVVYDPNGSRLVFYDKNYEVPQRFNICGIPSNLAICYDRGLSTRITSSTLSLKNLRKLASCN